MERFYLKIVYKKSSKGKERGDSGCKKIAAKYFVLFDIKGYIETRVKGLWCFPTYKTKALLLDQC